MVQHELRTPAVAAWTSVQLTVLSASLASPTVWASFLRQSFLRSRQDAGELPALRRSLRIWMFLAGGTLLLFRAIASRRFPSGVSVGWVTGMSLLAEWHLGMIPTRDNPSPTTLAPSNRLTLLRALLPAVFLGVYGRGQGSARAVAAIGGLATDLLDGLLARRTRMQTHFGAVADPLADTVVWITLALTARGGHFPRVLAWLTCVRYGMPIIVSLAATLRQGATFDWARSRAGRWSSATIAVSLASCEIREAMRARRSIDARGDSRSLRFD